MLWGEDDYSVSPTVNQVLTIVDTNGVKSGRFCTHFSLLKSLKSGLRVPCLNHACDTGTNVMSDLFASADDRDNE